MEYQNKTKYYILNVNLTNTLYDIINVLNSQNNNNENIKPI